MGIRLQNRPNTNTNTFQNLKNEYEYEYEYFMKFLNEYEYSNTIRIYSLFDQCIRIRFNILIRIKLFEYIFGNIRILSEIEYNFL